MAQIVNPVYDKQLKKSYPVQQIIPCTPPPPPFPNQALVFGAQESLKTA